MTQEIRLLLLSFLLILASLLPVAPGQAASILSAAQGSESKPIQQEDVKKLIETLESDTARQDLITNLKLLLDQQQAAPTETLPEVIPALTEQLGFRGKISHLIKEYDTFLDKNDISSSLLHQALGTIVVAGIALVLLLIGRRAAARARRSLDALSEKSGIKLPRLGAYTKALQWLWRIIVGGISVYTFAKIWEWNDIAGFFEGSAMRGFLSAAVTTLLVAIIAVFVWEAIGAYLAYILKQADDKNQTRVKTLLPMFRNIVLTVFGILFGLVLLSEMGINVGPLIAGAGVVGVAIGFGAQTMVKDFITGFTIVVEDVIRVGDVVMLDGCTGSVEKITLRKVQLRDVAGIVYTIPFSQISTIQNMTKNFSFYVLEVGVSYSQNTDRVVEVLKEVDDSLRQDEKFGHLIMAPLEVLGVERFEDSAVVIKARIKTRPVKQWDVGREFNRRMKIAFDQYGIEIPFPQRVITVRNDTASPVTGK